LQENKKSYDEMLLKRFKSVENTLFFKKKLWILESNQLKLDIIREIHDQSVSEHSNVRRTCKYLNKWYYWSQVKQSVERYVRNCHICRRFKASRNKYSELLNSLSISNRSWTNIIMNFVIELSKIKDDFNAILMMIDRLTKMHHYLSCTIEKEDTSAEETARLLINFVWKLHELSSIIVFDRESQFVLFVWKIMCKLLNINVKLSTAFHSETNDQSEIANQKMKRYLRSYCNYQQNDWFEWLFMTEFASNVATSTFIELFVFMTNYEFESRMSFDSSNVETNDRLSERERILTQKATIIIEKMKNIWDFIKKKLVNAQEMQKKHADKHKTFSSDYQFEDMIWLFIKNIKTERSFRKLNHKWIDSFKIKKILKDVCQLNLSQSMKIHDIFHTSLLRKVAIDSLTDQIQSSSSSIVIEDEEKEYEIDDILDSRYHYEKLQYRVVWIDHLSDRAWYSTENFQNHSKEILNDYHQRYSEKFESELRVIVIIEAMLSQWIRNEHKEVKQLIQDVLDEMKAKMKENDRMRSKESSLTNTFDRR
jgi:ribosomal protein S17E